MACATRYRRGWSYTSIGCVFYTMGVDGNMVAIVKQGTGQAQCRVCGQKIKKEQIAVEVCGYQFSQQIHSEPKECCKRWNVITVIWNEKNYTWVEVYITINVLSVVVEWK